MTKPLLPAHPDSPELEQSLREAAAADRLSESSVRNIRTWLTDRRYADESPIVAQHIRDHRWPELEAAFWTVIPFGTAGRRGRMYPIGCNAINRRTIGESVQGLADYVRERFPDGAPWRCAVAFDTRHRSRDFAELSAEILVAAGFQVFFFDGYRSTPELAFTVRDKQCHDGVMISASHNPPSDNAIKVFWSDGGQVRPPQDQGIIDHVARVTDISRMAFDQALAAGKVQLVQDEMDTKYRDVVVRQGFAGPTDLSILFSSLHGVALTSVLPVLHAAGFDQVEVFGPHAAPDGDFPNVPRHIANPEEHAVYDSMIEHARKSNIDLILASDPDADRIGCAVRRSIVDSDWVVLNGNQIAGLLAEFILRKRREAGTLTSDHFIVKSLVTTDLLLAIAAHHGVRAIGDVLTGFKWIGAAIDEHGPERFVFGAEEAHGYLAGNYIRDKDGAVAALLLAQFAAETKAAKRTLLDELNTLYRLHGYFEERTIALTMPGANGMIRMTEIMQQFRESPLTSFAGLNVRQRRDYHSRVITPNVGDATTLEGPVGDVLFFDLEPRGNHVAIRPSGTEPKLKVYLFVHEPPASNNASEKLSLDVLQQQKAIARQRLDALEQDVRGRIA